MHPALSVIFFTVASGMGYGLMFWAAIGALAGASPRPLLAGVALGIVCATAGLLSSLGHLGKPARAWRAFSQWRTSWLSREGVAAVATYVPALALGAALLPGMVSGDAAGTPAVLGPGGRVAAVALALLALATVGCTAMIYASLPPIPAWRHRLVVPGYLLFALFTGGLATAFLHAALAATPHVGALPLLAGALALALLKHRYWRDLREPLPVQRGDAVGLPGRTVGVFERPHTEGNFVTREMVFVLARRHADRLRRIALVLFALVPALCALSLALPHVEATWPLAVASLSALAGAFVERWLFFAQARHLVSLYY
ncbi:DmsC/YnfH family molybdoenzyme membrane anchor subunit [Lysobacter sp. N42]|uniref:dimethyl sulfoxide reductase anchor subunit family protein n=1 Tax=Lysobacter sp. N42 TaxID=2545719 RepID=UPI001050A7E4|nr:DmsC/YnfH family molybdoenzyme membrane anchor subunit [Lysobacter sp. N42]TCZ84307.1 dimethyl sulfoxide reductase anchor subunit [Lysobacter sp. N42]